MDPPEPGLLALALNNQGVDLLRLRKPIAAMDPLKAALKLREQAACGEPDADIAQSLGNIAKALLDARRFVEAAGRYQHVLDYCDRLGLPPEHDPTGPSLGRPRRNRCTRRQTRPGRRALRRVIPSIRWHSQRRDAASGESSPEARTRATGGCRRGVTKQPTPVPSTRSWFFTSHDAGCRAPHHRDHRPIAADRPTRPPTPVERARNHALQPLSPRFSLELRTVVNRREIPRKHWGSRTAVLACSRLFPARGTAKGPHRRLLRSLCLPDQNLGRGRPAGRPRPRLSVGHGCEDA